VEDVIERVCVDINLSDFITSVQTSPLGIGDHKSRYGVRNGYVYVGGCGKVALEHGGFNFQTVCNLSIHLSYITHHASLHQGFPVSVWSDRKDLLS
jgi:hypothetical protein